MFARTLPSPEVYISPYYCPRTAALKKICDIWHNENIILVRSPSYTGKTTLAFLLVSFLQAQQKNVIYVSLAEMSLTRDFSQIWALSSGHQEDFWSFLFTNRSEVFIIFDEFQLAYRFLEDPIWPLIKELADGFQLNHVKAICFADYAHSSIFLRPSVSIDLSQSKGKVVSLNLLRLSPQEMNSIILTFHKKTGCQLPQVWIDYLISHTEDRHIGFFYLLLKRFLEKGADEFAAYQTSSHLYNDILRSSALTGLRNQMATFSTGSIRLLKRAIHSKTSLKINWSSAAQAAAAELLLGSGCLAIIENRTLIFSCPLVQDVVHRELFIKNSGRDVCLYNNLQDFCLHVLSNLRQELFQNSISVSTRDDIVSEKFWQSEFYTVASQVVSDKAHIHSEAARGSGVIDFMLIDGFRWGVELLICCNDLKKHMDRFAPNSTYQAQKLHQWLVIDFRPLGTKTPNYETLVAEKSEVEPSSNLWIVYFSEDYSTLFMLNGKDEKNFHKILTLK